MGSQIFEAKFFIINQYFASQKSLFTDFFFSLDVIVGVRIIYS